MKRIIIFVLQKKFDTKGLQLGDTRPLSECLFSPNSKDLLVSSWGGTIKLWDVESFTEKNTYKGCIFTVITCNTYKNYLQVTMTECVE